MKKNKTFLIITLIILIALLIGYIIFYISNTLNNSEEDTKHIIPEDNIEDNQILWMLYQIEITTEEGNKKTENRDYKITLEFLDNNANICIGEETCISTTYRFEGDKYFIDSMEELNLYGIATIVNNQLLLTNEMEDGSIYKYYFTRTGG